MAGRLRRRWRRWPSCPKGLPRIHRTHRAFGPGTGLQRRANLGHHGHRIAAEQDGIHHHHTSVPSASRRVR